MPDLQNIVLKPDGKRISTPPLDDAANNGYVIVLEGTFRFGHNGTILDAVYEFKENGDVMGRHGLLAWSPQAPELMSENVVSHRYVFRIPASWAMDGQSLAVGLDTDRLLEIYKEPTSELLNSLTGEMRMITRSDPAGVAVPVWAVLGGPAVGLLAATAWVIRRRRSYGGLDGDLVRSLEDLQARTAAALKLAAGQRKGSREIRTRLAKLQRGAVEIAQRLQAIRGSLRLTDTGRTAAEIQTLESRLASVTETSTRLELESALDQKRKAISAANDLRAAEERCRLRLAKIEGVVDSACLQLQRADVGERAGPVEDTVLRELDSEVRAVGEVARQTEEQAYLRVR